MTRGRRRLCLITAVSVAAALTLTAGPSSRVPAAASPSATSGVSYTYDAAGRLASVTDPAGSTRTFTYDAVGNLLTIAAGAASHGEPVSVTHPAVDRDIASLSANYQNGTLVLTGTNLPGQAEAQVKVGGLFAVVHSSDTRRLVADIPPGLAAGKTTVTVATQQNRLATTSVDLPGKPAAAPSADSDLPALRAEPGVTAIAGRVRDSHSGNGLGGVLVAIGDQRTRTHSDGRFLLEKVSAGHHEMLIDASAEPDHGIFEVGVVAVRGRTTPMSWTTWLTAVDSSHAVALPAKLTHEVVVTSPSMPGLEVHVPAGTTLTGHDGRRVTALSITKMPLDRQPYPGAPGMTLAWTIQPGDATVSGAGLQVVYPNLAHQAPGTAIDYVDHDSDRRGLGWAVYGHGRVSTDATKIVPDATTRLHETYQLGVSYNPLCTYLGVFCPHTGDDDKAADPVDLQTGLFVFSRSDLVMPDVLPIALTRTYRQNDDVIRSFGVGQSDAFNSFVSPDNNGHYVVQMPDGSSVPFVPTDDPTVYTATPTPSALTGATMSTDNHRNFTVTLTSGRVFTFGGETASLVSVADRFGNATTISRNSSGQLTGVTSPNGRWITVTWGACNSNSSQCIVAAKDNLGRTVSYGYDNSGRMVSVTDPAGKKTSYGWAACDDSVTCTELLSITDPLGAKFVTNTYNSDGRVATQRQANGASYSFAYTVAADGHVSSVLVTDPRHLQRQVGFDSSGYSVSDTSAYGTSIKQTTTVTRDSAHRILTTTDPLTRKSSTTYNAAGDVLSVTDLAGTSSSIASSFTYEPTYHRVASATDPLGHVTTFTYDDDAQTVTSTDPLGRTTSAGLSEGQPTSFTDALGNVSYVSYLDGEPVTTVDPLGRTTHSYFDAGGRLTKVTDPLGDRTTFSYDVMNDQLTATDPLGHATKSTYDADGQVKTVTDPLGHVTGYTYDPTGQLLARTDALSKSQLYTYDLDGNVATSTDRLGSRTDYTYDALNRPTSIGYKATVSGTSTTYQSTMTNTYDTGNRLTKTVDSTAGTISRTYDTLDRLLTETTPQGGTTYSYDKASRRIGLTVTGQPAATYTYDNANQLKALTGASAGNVALAYDADGRIVTKTLPGSVQQAFTYDAASQLSGLTYTKGTTTLGSLTYAYDSAGRRTAIGGTFARAGLPAAVASSTYNADNALTARGSTSLAYDAEGQLTTDGTTTYTWNARHQLTGTTAGTASTSFTYDQFGRRQTRKVGSVSTGFVYDGANLVQERAGSGASVNLLTGLGVDETFARNDGTSTTSLLTDALGSTVALTNASGAVATSYTYDPFGAVTSSGTTTSNTLKFTGREDDGTGLDYNRARYYSPRLERFISQDPAGAAGSGNNLYAYVSDSPTNATDPSGQFGLVGCAVGAGISVLGGFLIHKLSGQKYTFTDGVVDAGIGCISGAIDNVGGIADNLEREGAEASESTVAAAAETAGSDWPELSGVLRDAARGKGNFGLGAGTQEQATAAGDAWVGSNASLASDGKTLVSEDGLRQFRPPSYKPNLDQWQANFESRVMPRGPWQGNGHLDITDPP